MTPDTRAFFLAQMEAEGIDPNGVEAQSFLARQEVSLSLADFDHYDDDDECWNCGGEGSYSDCFEEFACIDPESGCDLCTRVCDVCRGKGKL